MQPADTKPAAIRKITLSLLPGVNSDEELRQKLQAWQPHPDVPARFQAEVWARIGANASARPSTWVERIFDELMPALAQPRYAFGLIAAAVLLGLGLAGHSARSTQAERSRTLEARYFRSIDPYLSLVANEP